MARRALVTGANRGIGLAVAQALAAAGLEVLVGGRDEAAVGEAADLVPRSLPDDGPSGGFSHEGRPEPW